MPEEKKKPELDALLKAKSDALRLLSLKLRAEREHKRAALKKMKKKKWYREETCEDG
ncbi:MAG: hypothetical protein HY592_03080 [Candidatus Omnitrophica bacterium]|nr:hypothetical protein [Candidatus Omnitrophota bacterium]